MKRATLYFLPIPTEILIFIFVIFFRYVIKEHSDSLTSIQRSLIVWAILNRTRYEDKSPEKVGIQRLVTKNVYKSAYPLHGGFQLLDLIITELKSHMTCSKFKVSHWWKFYLSKKSFTRFALQSECCNFNQ